MIQFDQYVSNGLLQPPTKNTFELVEKTKMQETNKVWDSENSGGVHPQINPTSIHVWYIHLHEWLIFMGSM